MTCQSSVNQGYTVPKRWRGQAVRWTAAGGDELEDRWAVYWTMKWSHTSCHLLALQCQPRPAPRWCLHPTSDTTQQQTLLPCATQDVYISWSLQAPRSRDSTRLLKTSTPSNTQHTYNRFTALLDFVRDYPGEQVPER